jgi:hypothetical protein
MEMLSNDQEYWFEMTVTVFVDVDLPKLMAD